MAKTPRKPLDEGFKRTLKIVGGAVGIGVLAMGYMVYSTNTRSTDIQQNTNLGQVMTSAQRGESQISEATRAKLARVHNEEAKQAQREGRAYIPEMIFGEPIPVVEKEEETNERQFQEPERMPSNRHAGNPMRPVMDEARKAEMQIIEQGLLSQMQMVLGGMAPATATSVEIAFDPNAGAKARAQQAAAAAQNPQDAGSSDKAKGPELAGGDEIMAAVITTPINTDVTTFAMAEIVGGKLAGAQLRGQIVPMNMSGDIEDVGIRFTSMRFKGQHYPIDAIALNEQTATDAMDGSVDRRLISRYVMPVVMAGLSGVSSYFTARGTPSISVAAGYGDGAVIVDQERADKEDAKNQGIGDAIDKTVQTGDRIVQQQGSRPNRVELAANTPIGVIFNQAVHAQ